LVKVAGKEVEVVIVAQEEMEEGVVDTEEEKAMAEVNVGARKCSARKDKIPHFRDSELRR